MALAPQGPGLFGSSTSGWVISAATARPPARSHWKRRGSRSEDLRQFNRAGAPPWWAYSKVVPARRSINKLVLKDVR